MMEFYLLDASLNIIAIIDNYKSAIWTSRYFKPGDFELYIPANAELLQTIERGQIIVRTDNVTAGAFIESIKVDTDAEDGNYITIKGKSLASILARRIVWTQTTYNGDFEKTVRCLVADNMIEPDDADRAISVVGLADPIGYSEQIKVQFTGDTVEKAVQSLLEPRKLGYDVFVDIEHKKLNFGILQGVDRSYNQQANPWIIFSPEYDNLISTSYSNDDSKYSNVAQVAGEGQGIGRKKTVVGSAEGLSRYELFVDARNQSTNDGEIDETTYIANLATKGAEKLAERATVEKISSSVAPNIGHKFGEDYFLGDVVEVINEYGMQMTPRVTEVTECQDDTGYTCIPKFAAD